MTLEQEIKEYLEHAEGVGEKTARDIADHVKNDFQTLDSFIHNIYENSKTRQKIGEVKGVGQQVVQSTYDLTHSVVQGEAVVITDNFDKIRVIHQKREEEFT